ncbi:hypothetical protein GGI43DRAFT_398320, partial [Trichoderma evansii]
MRHQHYCLVSLCSPLRIISLPQTRKIVSLSINDSELKLLGCGITTTTGGVCGTIDFLFFSQLEIIHVIRATILLPFSFSLFSLSGWIWFVVYSTQNGTLFVLVSLLFRISTLVCFP